MKTLCHLSLMVIALLFASARIFAETPSVPNHRITANWGSLRTPYAAVSSGLAYEMQRLSPDLPLGLEARIDSFGTFFTIGSPSFDLLIAVSGRWNGPIDGTLWAAGVGALLEARLGNDVRSAAKTGGAPLIRFSFEGQFPIGGRGLTWGGKLPFEIDFYRNGVALSCDPELRIGYGFTFASLRVKSRWLLRGVDFDSEYRWDSNLGIGLAF